MKAFIICATLALPCSALAQDVSAVCKHAGALAAKQAHSHAKLVMEMDGFERQMYFAAKERNSTDWDGISLVIAEFENWRSEFLDDAAKSLILDIKILSALCSG